MLEINKIYNMDCIEGLKLLPDKCVDLILTDPPYNVNLDYNLYQDDKSEEKYSDWCKSWFFELKRICKGLILITIGNGNQHIWYRIEKPRGVMMWYKPNSCSPSKLCGINVFEPIFVYLCSETMHHPIGIDVITQNINIQTEIGNHPCPKPLKLFRKLIEMLSKECDIVLDCFIGSGTTAVACKQLNRNFIGFEIDKHYIDIANERLKQTNIKKWF